jgi:hypothetical protein
LEEAKAVIEIRKILDYEADNFKIHTELQLKQDQFPIMNNEKDNKERLKWYRYLGTIELVGIMLKKGIISEDVFDNQFGYKVTNISTCKPLMKHIEDEPQYWKELLDLINRVKSKTNN